MNLKNQFNVVWQPKVKPVGAMVKRVRFAISINQLPKYIGQKRSEIIIKNLLNSKSQSKRYSVQNKGVLSIYCK